MAALKVALLVALTDMQVFGWVDLLAVLTVAGKDFDAEISMVARLAAT